ncbi:MAG: carboxypeptidase-like regulatory domain-containing protein [Flavobacteriales bacterium]
MQTRYVLPEKAVMLMFLLSLLSFPFQAASPFECKVIDEATREPLAFANVVVEGTGNGSVTNIDGVFVLDISELSSQQMILISYLGYQTKRISVKEMSSQREIMLQKAALNLSEVIVPTKRLTAEQIIKLVEEHFEDNYPAVDAQQRMFYHYYQRTPNPGRNGIKVKRSNFPGLDKSLMEEIMALLPDQFVEYQDVIVDLYSHDGSQKLKPIQAISLEEGQQEEFEKKAEEKLEVLMKNIGESKEQEGVYYKIRTGFLSQKIDSEDEEQESEESDEEDRNHMETPTEFVKSDIQHIIREFAHFNSDCWEFITESGHYKYTLDDATVLDSHVVYQIHFKPKRKGIYEGTVYISVDDFAVLMVDYAFAAGKEDEAIQLLGVGHAIRDKRSRVLFEPFGDGYAVKYINARELEYFGVERTFSIMKKQKRFLIDKELAEIKFDTDLKFENYSEYELLVMNRKHISESFYESMEEPKTVVYRKELMNSREMWNNQTVIAPAESLKTFRRQQ